MPAFDFEEALRRAQHRTAPSTRAPRADRGRSRLDPAVLRLLTELTSTQERPRTRVLLETLRRRCEERKLKAPSRATVYAMLDRLPCPTRLKRDLPPAVQDALYNLAPESEVPLHQIAFYCFNYGDMRAVSYASGLPWLALHQARRTRGHRPKSAGILDAVMHLRRI